MEPDGSLQHSQMPATCPYPEPARSSPYTHIYFLKIHLILSSHLRLGLPSGLFTSGFPTKTLHTPPLSPIRAPCPAHLILLDFIIRTILGVQYRSLNCSLCSFLHSPVTSSLLRLKILLSTLFERKFSRYSWRLSDGFVHPGLSTLPYASVQTGRDMYRSGRRTASDCNRTPLTELSRFT